MVQRLREDVERYRRATTQTVLAASGSLCSCDLFFWFIAKRSAAITSAFADAVEQENHFVSPALVRMQLSSLLGLYAAHYHEQGLHECVAEWMKGRSFSQMGDNGTDGAKLMRDGHLLQRIDAEFSNQVGSIEKLYGMASGWIHLDPKFFHSLTNHVGDNGEVQFALHGPQFKIPHMGTEDDKNWVVSMLSINNLMIAKLLMWASCKQEIWGGLPEANSETGRLEVGRFETVATANGLEAVILDRGKVEEDGRFLLWVNATVPKKNLAYAEFTTIEQAETFVSWYIQTLNEAQNHKRTTK